MKASRLLLCSFVVLSYLCVTRCPAELRVEVVDDTGAANSPYLLLVAKPAPSSLSVSAGTGKLALANAAEATNNVAPLPVSKLQDAGYTVTSPYTGQKRTVRYFTIDSIGSGAFMVFQNDGSGTPPFTYVNNANPSPSTSNFRFDQCEITYNPTIDSGANLTAIDALSMPMQFEHFIGVQPALTKVGERRFYNSLESILKRFPSRLSPALFQKGTGSSPKGGWKPSDGMSTFLRALGPGQVAAISGTNTKGSPAPFPSFTPYLVSLAALTPTTPADVKALAPVGQIAQVDVAIPGSGYPASTTVNFKRKGSGTATNATATVQVNSGQVATVKLTTGGTGYFEAPKAVFSGSPGTGATANVYVDSGISRITVTSPGSGYSVAPAVTIVGGGGKGATAVATLNATGGVSDIIVTQPGDGYNSVPTVKLSAFNVSGTSNTIDYNYAGNVVATSSGYAMVLNGTTYNEGTSTPAAGKNKNCLVLPIDAQVTIHLPASGQASPPVGSGDSFIYGAALSSDSFSVAGLSDTQLASDTNIVYGAIVRDALAAINFGFLRSKLGNMGSLWYSSIPSDAPFGSARATNDGFYNPWAALIYNNSDAYGFAFSDRTHPSPLMKLGVGPVVPEGAVETLRITILPDLWLDAPDPKVTNPTDTTLPLSWDAVSVPSGFAITGYTLTVLDPPGTDPIAIGGKVKSYTLGSATPLRSGTQYTLSLAVEGTRNGKPITSTSEPIQQVTTGTAAAISGTHQFNVTLSYDPPGGLAGPFTANIGGQTLDYEVSTRQWQQDGRNAILSGNTGLNIYSVSLSNSTDGTFFNTNLAVTLDSAGNVTTTSYFGGQVNHVGSGSGSVLTLLLNNDIPVKLFAPVISRP